ncbi:hypothetical protein HRM2_20850 [Desulforapulum autotrophicum HRM2]|uniref:Uncharacterized protein n=1 Tax=Desulforapulum autotrophicum (strain ATCC 43914 / DSM 3382 / VKM B-1955 / HRM2) TaxID=177437 RepID=C0QDC0_DESAH|nr:hypothetical protein [Desulforapulum autotrophicum]ACN15184.1 hypothetical protein HRM2_20850 [Desulforapulum autotrophicum HRM2]
MIIKLKNTETGKVTTCKLSTRNLIYTETEYRFEVFQTLRIMAGSKIKYEGSTVPGYEYTPILLKPKQIENALGNIGDRGEPGGIKSLQKALQELQVKAKEVPELPL